MVIIKKLFTSESVTEGHPDKLCDYISDSILDCYLQKDKNARVACETIASNNIIFITGQITSNAKVDIEKVTRNAIKEIGYNNAETGIDFRTCKIIINISEQSKDIAIGVNNSYEKRKLQNINSEGAGDQGIIFGYACDETKELMPLSIVLAHKLAQRLSDVRKNGIINYLQPDGKVQVTIEYKDNIPKRVDTVVVSAQHNQDIEMKKIEMDLKKLVINQVIPQKLIDKKTKYYINPTGRFVIGGPLGDSGLTRKEDNCRYLWRICKTWRRSIFW